MSYLQKQAWMTVILTCVCTILFAGLCPTFGVQPSLSVFSLFGVTGFGPLIFKPTSGDERDRAINRRAVLLGGMASYLVFVIACMGTWNMVYFVKGSEQISVHTLALITGAGGFTYFNAHAVAVLLLYRSRLEADHG